MQNSYDLRHLAWLVTTALALVTFFASISTYTLEDKSTLDNLLSKVIKEYNLRPLQVRHFDADPKFVLGRALFFDPILSGTRDVSCATCHLLKFGTSDGRPRSIGVLGIGVGPRRQPKIGKVAHRRNALDLWNRDNNAVKALFWDGRVEVLDPVHRIFRSPLGKALPSGLDNALAVQALFPLATPDEMLGELNDNSPSSLPGGNGGLPNDLVSTKVFATEAARIQDSHNRLIARLFGLGKPNQWQKEYLKLFEAAYPAKVQNSYSIVDLANAIAHFEEMAFATRGSAWDRFLNGNQEAISAQAKEGALLFYGRARCVACHNGPLFSDFDYHSVGIFSSNTGVDGAGLDYGRWRATGLSSDKFKFRTPPLRNVTKTAPYFHDGSEATLRGALQRHLNPLNRADKYNYDGSFSMSRDEIDSISPVLIPGVVLSEADLQALITFFPAWILIQQTLMKSYRQAFRVAYTRATEKHD